MPQSLPSDSPKLILIGEDDIDDQEFLKEVFSSIDSSFTVLFVGHGDELIKYFQGSTDPALPCLIVLDYNMPGLTGVEILKELKSIPRCHSIPIIIWSTSDSQVYRQECLQLGANDFLVKPANFNGLIETCKYMLSSCVI